MNNSKTVEVNIFRAYSPKTKQLQVKSKQLALLIQYHANYMPICNTDKVKVNNVQSLGVTYRLSFRCFLKLFTEEEVSYNALNS